MKSIPKLIKIAAVSLSLNGCDDVHVYGNVGYSSYNGYGGSGRGGLGTSISVGGRIF